MPGPGEARGTCGSDGCAARRTKSAIRGTLGTIRKGQPSPDECCQRTCDGFETKTGALANRIRTQNPSATSRANLQRRAGLKATMPIWRYRRVGVLHETLALFGITKDGGKRPNNQLCFILARNAWDTPERCGDSLVARQLRRPTGGKWRFLGGR